MTDTKTTRRPARRPRSKRPEPDGKALMDEVLASHGHAGGIHPYLDAKYPHTTEEIADPDAAVAEPVGELCRLEVEHGTNWATDPRDNRLTTDGEQRRVVDAWHTESRERVHGPLREHYSPAAEAVPWAKYGPGTAEAVAAAAGAPETAHEAPPSTPGAAGDDDATAVLGEQTESGEEEDGF